MNYEEDGKLSYLHPAEYLDRSRESAKTPIVIPSTEETNLITGNLPTEESNEAAEIVEDFFDEEAEIRFQVDLHRVPIVVRKLEILEELLSIINTEADVPEFIRELIRRRIDAARNVYAEFELTVYGETKHYTVYHTGGTNFGVSHDNL